MRAITPMKDDLARKIRATAASVDKTHPETVAAQHLRNAAMLVQHGQGDGAKRHLDAAMELMTPRNLMRHGITDDEGHATAKTAMHQMNVHRLGVMDIQDAQARNSKEADAKKQASDQQTAAKQAAAAAKQQATTPPQPPASGSGQQNGQQSQPPASPPGKPPAGGNQQGQQASAASNTWPTPILAQSFSNVDLSARTAMLEHTPAPYGKPGGPGLYGKAGNKHSDYFEQIVTALMTKRGMDKATASKIAWGALRKWRAGGGSVHPEVRAAAAGALVKEAAAGARAALANSTDAIELGWRDAYKTEDRGKGGQWVGELSGAVRDLAKSGDLDNSEASDHLRKAADAIDAQDQDTARQHLTAAYSAVAAPLRGKGNESDYQHRAARGTLNQIRGHLNAINDLPRSPQDHSNWDIIDRLIELACPFGPAIELAGDGWKNAWRHELRGPGGQFVPGAGGALTAGSRAAASRRVVKSGMVHQSGMSSFASSPHSLRAAAGAPKPLALPRTVGPEADDATRQDATRRALLAFTQKQLSDAINTPAQTMTPHQLEVSTRVIAGLTDHELARTTEKLTKVVTPSVAGHVKKHLEGLRQELNKATQEDAKHALIFHIAMILGAVGISLAAGGLGVPAGIAAIIAVTPSIAQELRDWRAAQQTIGNTEKMSPREIEKNLASTISGWLDLAQTARFAAP